jgi:hypothetical protein
LPISIVKPAFVTYSFPNEKPTVWAVLSEISNPNGKIRQTGEATIENEGRFSKWRMEMVSFSASGF